MNAIFAAAKEVADFMQARGWEYCIIGGLAVQRWGELRTTRKPLRSVRNSTAARSFDNSNRFAS